MAWHWASQTFRPASRGKQHCWRLLLAPPHFFKPTPTSIWAKVHYRGEELSSTIDNGGESESFYEALTGARELQQLVAARAARLDWLGDLRWSCPLQPLQSHCHPPLHYSWPPTGPKRPSPRSALSEGLFQLKNNFATLLLCNSFCKTASPRLLWHEKYTLSWTDHCGYRRYYNQGLSHHCALVVAVRGGPLT